MGLFTGLFQHCLLVLEKFDLSLGGFCSLGFLEVADYVRPSQNLSAHSDAVGGLDEEF